MITYLLYFTSLVTVAFSSDSSSVLVGDESNFGKLITDYEFALVKLYVSFATPHIYITEHTIYEEI
jgi:hypothetical protein